MMSDHWKSLARILGAPGAADPPAKSETTKPVSARTVPAKVAVPPETDSAELPKDLTVAEPPAPAAPPKDILGFTSFNALDEGQENDLDSVFKPQKTRSESPAAKEPAAPAPATNSGRTPLDEFLGSPAEEPSKGPSSWDELIDRLGVADTGPSPEKTSPARGFGSGLGVDANKPQEIVEKKPVSAKIVEPDPLAELGDLGWGQPRRKSASQQKPAAAPAPTERPSESPASEETRGAREARPPREPSEGRAPREARGPRENREPRPESREPRPESREPRPESREPRPVREPRGDSREPRPRNSPRTTGNESTGRSSANTDVERSEVAASGDDGDQKSPRRGRRRGQRQKLDSDVLSWDDEPLSPTARRSADADADGDDEDRKGRVPYGNMDLDDEPDDDLDGPQGEAGVDEAAGEAAPRRRRRRGRRRRGGDFTGEAAEKDSRDDATRDEIASEPPEISSTGRAIDAEFDDDHEDDDEAVALRRSRRRRRRRPSDGVSEPAADADQVLPSDDDDDPFGAEVFETGGFDGEILEVDDADEAVSYNIQRNVPTWLEAVDILISANVESRKRDPKRGGGGGGGNGRGPRPRRRE